MKVHWTIVTTLYVIFARPDKFDWRSAQTFRDHGSLALYVGVDHGAPAEAAAGHLRMKSDLLRFEPENLCDGHVIESLELRTSPGFGAIAIEAHSRIQRLHRCMSEKGKLIFRDNAIACGELVD